MILPHAPILSLAHVIVVVLLHLHPLLLWCVFALAAWTIITLPILAVLLALALSEARLLLIVGLTNRPHLGHFLIQSSGILDVRPWVLRLSHALLAICLCSFALFSWYCRPLLRAPHVRRTTWAVALPTCTLFGLRVAPASRHPAWSTLRIPIAMTITCLSTLTMIPWTLCRVPVPISHVPWHVRHLTLHALHLLHLALHLLHAGHAWLHVTHVPCCPGHHHKLHVWMELLPLGTTCVLTICTRLLLGTHRHLALHHVLGHHHALHGLEDVATISTAAASTPTTRIALAWASASTMLHHLVLLCLSGLCLCSLSLGSLVHVLGHGAIRHALRHLSSLRHSLWHLLGHAWLHVLRHTLRHPLSHALHTHRVALHGIAWMGSLTLIHLMSHLVLELFHIAIRHLRHLPGRGHSWMLEHHLSLHHLRREMAGVRIHGSEKRVSEVLSKQRVRQ